MFVTSDGSPYVRLRRAIQARNLAIIQVTVAELGHVGLRDALGILLVMQAKDGSASRPRPCAGRGGSRWRRRA